MPNKNNSVSQELRHKLKTENMIQALYNAQRYHDQLVAIEKTKVYNNGEGESTNKVILGPTGIEDPFYNVNNGMNPNNNGATAINIDRPGSHIHIPNQPRKPIPYTQTDGAHSFDASSNGTELDILALQSTGVSFEQNQEDVLQLPSNMSIMADESGNIKWFGQKHVHVAGEEVTIMRNNGKTRILNNTSPQYYCQTTPFIPGTCASKGMGDNIFVNGPNATGTLEAKAVKGEWDTLQDFAAISTSSSNDSEIKTNDNNEFCRMVLNANDGKITLTITGGEKQYNSTIVMTGDDILCTTHLFRVIANDEIDLYAGNQKSSIIMNKSNIAMKATKIKQNCGGLLPVPIPVPIPSIPGLNGVIGNIANGLVQNLAQNALGNLNFGSFGGPLAMGISALTGGGFDIKSGLTALAGQALGASGLGNILGNIGNIGSMLDIGNIANGALGKIGVGEIFNSVSGSLGKVGEVFNSVVNPVTQVVSNIQGTIDKVIEPAKTAVAGISQTINQGISGVNDFVEKTVGQGTQQIVNQAGEIFNKAANTATDTINRVTQQVTGPVNKVINNVTSEVNRATSGLQNTFNKVTNIPNIDPNKQIDFSSLPVWQLNSLEVHQNDIAEVHANAITIDIWKEIIDAQEDFTAEEKKELYQYIFNVYELEQLIQRLYQLLVFDIPLALFNLYFIYMYYYVLNKYLNTWIKIINDYTENTNTVTILQIENDIASMKINILQAKETMKTQIENEMLRENILTSLNVFLSDYIDFSDTLITIIKNNNAFKATLTEADYEETYIENEEE